jgi:hypothetical protein
MRQLRLIEATLFSVSYCGPTRKHESGQARSGFFVTANNASFPISAFALTFSSVLRRKEHSHKAKHRVRIHRRRQGVLARFDARYEQLVDLLCLAAQCSDVSRFRERYRKLRQALIRDYIVLRRQMVFVVNQTWPEILTTPFDYLLSTEEIDGLISDLAVMDIMVNCRWLLDATQLEMLNGEPGS